MPIQRYSRERERIYQVLQEGRCHPTAEMIYDKLKPSMPRLSLGTVYRNLQQMADEGYIRRLEGPSARFDAEVRPHSHLYCRRCGRMLDLPVPYDEALDRAAEESGCQVERHELVFEGICSACMGKDRDQAADAASDI